MEKHGFFERAGFDRADTAADALKRNASAIPILSLPFSFARGSGRSSSMEPWCVEIKSGKSHKITPGDGEVVHVTKACLGEMKEKRDDVIILFVKINGQKDSIETLYPQERIHVYDDLKYDTEIEIYHNLQNGTIYFSGHKTRKHDNVKEDNSFDQDKPRKKRHAASLSKSEDKAKAKVDYAERIVLRNITHLQKISGDHEVAGDLISKIREEVLTVFDDAEVQIRILKREKVEPIKDVIIEQLKEAIGYLKERRKILSEDDSACKVID